MTSQSARDLSTISISFLGAGNLAEALIAGLTKSSYLQASQIRVANRRRSERLQQLASVYGIQATPHVSELLTGADLLILAIKPDDAATALQSIKPQLSSSTTVVSLL